MKDFNQIITKLNEDYQATVRADTGEGYMKLSTIVGELEQYLREYVQDLSAEDTKRVLKKLKGNEAILPEDLDLIRLWLVGDADYYIQSENNLTDWNKELARLIDLMNSCNVDNPDIATVSRFRSLLRDATRVVADILYYQQQKDRLNKFSDATQNIDAEERATLIRLLEQKMKNKDF